MDTKNTIVPIKSILAIIVIFLIGIGCIIIWSNMSNHRVQAGFAGYNFTKPIFGKNEFQRILVGPDATGMVWRQDVVKVSITPYTTMESFNNSSAILGKDKLPISCQASMVYRLDPTRIQSFMENYGGIAQTGGKDEDDSADEIMKYAYNNFIQQPFRTAIRTELSKYAALEASSNLQKISDDVLTQVRKRLEGTPFVVDSVAVGETTPPPAIVEAVIQKVKSSQENERKSIELEIEQKNIAIQKAKGEAQGAMKYQIALQEAQATIEKGKADAEVLKVEGDAKAQAMLMSAEAEAKGIALKEKSMGNKFLQYTMYQNMLNNAKLYLPTGSGTDKQSMPFMGLFHMNESNEKLPAPAPVQGN